MALNLGVHVKEQATSVSTPVLADVGVPYVVGAAPVFSASKPSKTGVPVLCTSWDEAVEKLGFSYDWKKYPLCEFMYSHFKLYGCQPVIFCNVLDAAKHKEVLAARDYTVEDHRVRLPFTAIAESIRIEKAVEDYAKAGIVVDAETAKAVLSRGGTPTESCEAYTFYQEADASVFMGSDHLFTVEAGGKVYSIRCKKSKMDVNRKRVYFSLGTGIQIDYVDGVRTENNAAPALDLSHYTGDVKVSFYSCTIDEERDDAYPTDLSLIDEYTVKLEKGHGPEYFVQDVDYMVDYDADENASFVSLLSSGDAYDKTTLRISGELVKPEVSVTDIVAGLDAIDACLSKAGIIPDLICAPGWSHNTVVAALMATKAEAGINGLFRAKALIDCDSGETGVREYTELLEYKNRNNFVDENQILCWPMVKLGDYMFHMSTQLAGLMAQVDSGNGGVPFESPSNKNFQMDCCCLEDGTEVDLTFDQTVVMAGYGVVTALNFMSMGWTARNNYTACYPANTDVKDQFIPVSRMFDFVGNTLIRTFWSKLDKPMRLRLLDNIQDTVNIWLNGLVSQEYLLGARVELKGSENPLTNLLSGIISFHIYITPPVPAQEIEFTLEFDVEYLTSALNLAA